MTDLDAAANLDLDFIDFPTAWAIQKAGLAHTNTQCSALQSGGALLCDCSALPLRWAVLKSARDPSADVSALVERYLPQDGPEDVNG